MSISKHLTSEPRSLLLLPGLPFISVKLSALHGAVLLIVLLMKWSIYIYIYALPIHLQGLFPGLWSVLRTTQHILTCRDTSGGEVSQDIDCTCVHVDFVHDSNISSHNNFDQFFLASYIKLQLKCVGEWNDVQGYCFMINDPTQKRFAQLFAQLWPWWWNWGSMPIKTKVGPPLRLHAQSLPASGWRGKKRQDATPCYYYTPTTYTSPYCTLWSIVLPAPGWRGKKRQDATPC